jgi:GINS complex subunit 1
MWRLGKIVELWWDGRDHLLADVLTVPEKHFLEEFNQTVIDYMSSFPIDVDLRAYTWRPPLVQQLQVRGIKDYEFVSPSTQMTVSIATGKHFSMGFEDAEILIQQGIVCLADERGAGRVS